jgi:hypothetical protein
MNCNQRRVFWSCALYISPFSFFIFFIISGVGLSPLGTASTSGLLYKPQMIDEDDCGAIGGMKIGRGNRSTRGKPAPAPTFQFSRNVCESEMFPIFLNFVTFQMFLLSQISVLSDT